LLVSLASVSKLSEMQECVQDQKDYQEHINHSREYPTRSQLQLLCQLHSEGACFIKARISCEQPTANQSLAAEVPIFWHDPLKTKAVSCRERLIGGEKSGRGERI
jgi:hypothetical protein